jgi:molecular chaperone GrpE
VTDQINQHADGAAEVAAADPRGQSEAQSIAEAPDAAEGKSLEEQLLEARAEAAASYDKYLRTRADMENFKKRIERTYAENARRSRKELLVKLLAVKDNLERALQFGVASQTGEGILEGVRLTQYQLDQLLSQEGVQPIEAQGKPFDPRLEEAVQSVDDPTVADHTVVQVVRAGYTYGDEVLRPAQVIVSVHGQDS